MPATKEAVSDRAEQFVWEIQPAAARWVTRAIDALAARNPILQKLADQLREVTGTRLVDWVDHLALRETDSPGLIGELAGIGYNADRQVEQTVWRHTLGMFPPVIVNGGRAGIALRCDSVDTACVALPPVLGLPPVAPEKVIGPRGGMFRHVVLDDHVDARPVARRAPWLQPVRLDREFVATNRGRCPTPERNSQPPAELPRTRGRFRRGAEG